jgi:hypothetical protein
VAPVGIDHRRDGRPADLQGGKLGAEDAAAGVLGALLAHRQQPQEQLSGGHLPGRIQPLVEGLGAAGQRARHAPDLAVGPQGERGALPVLEELGQGVLQQRQGPRLVLDFGDQLGRQPWLQRQAHPLGGFPDGLLQLGGRQWRQRLGTGPE